MITANVLCPVSQWQQVSCPDPQRTSADCKLQEMLMFAVHAPGEILPWVLWKVVPVCLECTGKHCKILEIWAKSGACVAKIGVLQRSEILAKAGAFAADDVIPMALSGPFSGPMAT